MFSKAALSKGEKGGACGVCTAAVFIVPIKARALFFIIRAASSSFEKFNTYTPSANVSLMYGDKTGLCSTCKRLSCAARST